MVAIVAWHVFLTLLSLPVASALSSLSPQLLVPNFHETQDGTRRRTNRCGLLRSGPEATSSLPLDDPPPPTEGMLFFHTLFLRARLLIPTIVLSAQCGLLPTFPFFRNEGRTQYLPVLV